MVGGGGGGNGFLVKNLRNWEFLHSQIGSPPYNKYIRCGAKRECSEILRHYPML